MIPSAPDIDKNTQAVLGRINPGVEQYPHGHAAAAIGGIYHRYLRYSADGKRWYYWDGWRWQTEHAEAIVNELSIRFFVDHIHPTLKSLTPYARSNMLNNGYLKHVEEQLRKQRRLRCASTDFDAKSTFIGTPKGTVDLTNGNLVPAQPEHMISLQTGVELAPKGRKAPQWSAFIEWMTCGDKELARFLRMWLGSSLVGGCRDQKMVFLWGDSANGKSVLLRAIGLAAGLDNGYHETASPSLFMAQKDYSGSGLTPGLFKVALKRLVTGAEVPKGAEWDNQIIKQLCSDEPIAIRGMYRDEITVKPRCSVTLAGNDLPAFTGLDDAVRRRFVTVHCRAKVVEGQQRDDYGLELFEAEGPQILRWLVEGALDRENNGFFLPAAVQAASAAYFKSEDVLEMFVEEHFDRNLEGYVKTTDTYIEWQAYNKSLGRPKDLTMTAFSLRMQKMGFEKGLEAGSRQSILKGLSPKSDGLKGFGFK